MSPEASSIIGAIFRQGSIDIGFPSDRPWANSKHLEELEKLNIITNANGILKVTDAFRKYYEDLLVE